MLTHHEVHIVLHATDYYSSQLSIAINGQSYLHSTALATT